MNDTKGKRCWRNARGMLEGTEGHGAEGRTEALRFLASSGQLSGTPIRTTGALSMSLSSTTQWPHRKGIPSGQYSGDGTQSHDASIRAHLLLVRGCNGMLGHLPRQHHRPEAPTFSQMYSPHSTLTWTTTHRQG